MSTISAVPTNIITGALGVGKTTAILSLLANKPDSERWAILVNEFGEVGLDGAILSDGREAVFIREVPGGCMCCTSGLPMQIALNQLLGEARPDRLLIEPTGLGHPKEVLQALSEPHYRDVLDIQATFTLIDARKLVSERWRSHPVFQEQLEIADAIVATKTDLYTADDKPRLTEHLATLGLSQTPLLDHNETPLSVSILDQMASHKSKKIDAVHSHEHHHEHAHDHKPKPSAKAQTPSDVYKVANHGQGFYSYGWICSPERTFDLESVKRVFSTIQTERLKAIMLTENGPFMFNLSDGQLSVMSHEYDKDSRIEFLSDDKQMANEIAQHIEIELGINPLL